MATDPSPSAVAIEPIDTVTRLEARHRGAVVVGASHGGVYAGWCAAKGGVRAVILNDAGVGKDRAGIGSLDFLHDLGIPAATVDHTTACIADAADMAKNGRISFVNGAAQALGCAPGQAAMECAGLMRAAPLSGAAVPLYEEARFVIRAANDEPAVIGCDSASLLEPGDAGCIVITASHAALLGGRPDGLIGPGALALTFSDAGVGKDGAGVRRLPTLDEAGIAAAAVDARTARIGDARSCYEEGRLSHVNETARALGAAPGMTTIEFVERAGAPTGGGQER